MNLRLLLFLLAVSSFSLTCSSQNGRGAEAENTAGYGTKTFNNVYGLIIGVSDYKEVKPLEYADNDADLITRVIETNYPQSKNKVIKLTNNHANEYNILTGFSNITKNVKEGDLVIFYFAGHGDVENTAAASKGYLLAYDASNSREYDLGGAVSFDRIYDSISKMVSKKAEVYLITDACRSGSILNARGSSITSEGFGSLQTVTTKFISCNPKEESLELDSLQHGAFTYFLVKSMTGEADTEVDQLITIDELDNYLKKNVRKATGNKQTPRVEGNDEFAELFKSDPGLSSFLSPEGLNRDLASRGSGTATKSPQLVKFESALIDGDLYGKSTSARFLLDNWTKTKGASASELAQMKELLVESLLDRSQENMNRFLRGKPVVGNTEDYSGTIKDLRMAAELLGYNHFLTKTIEARANFFEAIEIIRKADPSNYQKAESILISLEKGDPNAAYINQGLAMLYVAKNNRDAAQAQLVKAEGKISTWDKPKNTDANLNIHAGKLDLAMKQLKEAETLSSDKSDVFLLRSQMHLANFELREAEKSIQLLKNSSPGSYETERTVIQGKIEELRGRIKYAETTYRNALKSDESNTSILLKLADLYRSQGDTLKAKEFYSKVLKLDPNDLAAKNAFAVLNKSVTSSDGLNYYDLNDVISYLNTLEKAKKNEEALTAVNKALEINNWNPEYYYQKGKFLYNLNRKTESVEALKKGIALSPYHYESIRALVYILIEQKKFTEADAILKQHDKYFQRSAKWLTFEYNAYKLMNSKMDLMAILEKAIKMDSFDLEPYRAIIMLHIENNGFQNAQKELKNLLVIGGDETDSKLFLIRTDEQVKREFSKRNYPYLYEGIEILLKESPMDLDYIYMAAMISYMKMDYERAELHLKELSKFLQTLSPGAQMEYYKLKGKILLETGKYEDAERVFNLHNQKATKPCYLGLAMAQYELGKKEQWVSNFRKDSETADFNEDALNRYQKMIAKSMK